MLCLRFVAEQRKRVAAGDDEVEAGRRALWVLRSEGIDIRVKQVWSTIPHPDTSETEKSGLF